MILFSRNQKGDQTMRRKKLFHGIALRMFLLAAIAPISLSTSLDAQSITTKGIDPKLSEMARAGDAEAQRLVGLHYDLGNDVPQDYSQAVYWYTKAAQKGLAKAQFNLALMYENGDGVPRDFSKAVYWYSKAADSGYWPAQSYLGLMYEYGDGKQTQQNYAEAYFWFSIAASSSEVDNSIIAAKDRDRVAIRLTPEELAKTQKRSTAWFARHSSQSRK